MLDKLVLCFVAFGPIIAGLASLYHFKAKDDERYWKLSREEREKGRS
jgi:hypothetical protein